MGRRQQQHLGRNPETSTDLAGRDHREDPSVSEETAAQLDDAKSISRALDEQEGMDREGAEDARSEPAPGRDTDRA